MKLAKYIFLAMGVLGLIASIYNTIHNQSISGQEIGFLAGVFLVFVSLNLNRLVTFKVPKS